MNRQRLEAVRDYMLAHPDRFNFYRWHEGKTHCIAGLSEVLFGPWYARLFRGRLLRNNRDRRFREGLRILELTPSQGEELFFLNGWRSEHRADLFLAAERIYNQRRCVRLAANEINAFIARHGLKGAVKKQLVQNLDSTSETQKTEQKRVSIFHS